MKFTTRQAAAVLRISRPQIYKYISESANNQVNDTIKIICELINRLSEKSRISFITESLELDNCDEQWPAKKPIEAPQNKKLA